MERQPTTDRMIQEYVPGKQVTLAHLIANPGKDLFKKLGLQDAVSAIGILTITPSEASIIACDIATKSGAVEIGFLDRFTGAVVLTGDVSAVEYALKQVTRTLGEAGANHGAEHGQQGNGAPELGDGNISLVENPPVQVHQKSLQGHDREHD